MEKLKLDISFEDLDDILFRDDDGTDLERGEIDRLMDEVESDGMET